MSELCILLSSVWLFGALGGVLICTDQPSPEQGILLHQTPTVGMIRLQSKDLLTLQSKDLLDSGLTPPGSAVAWRPRIPVVV